MVSMLRMLGGKDAWLSPIALRGSGAVWVIDEAGRRGIHDHEQRVCASLGSLVFLLSSSMASCA